MSGAFLMAEVPYGGNGFTLLLTDVSRQRKVLAEAAQNAVPRSGSGADGTNIFVCRDVSQEDTGRQGSVRLVLANVDLAQLDIQRQERLQWKLGMFLDSLDALLPDVPQLTGRSCGPVVSARLQEWEEELKVVQLPAAQELREARPVAKPAEPGSSWKYAAIAVGVLCLLGYWTAEWSGKPADVAAAGGEEIDVVPLDPEAAERVQPRVSRQNASQQIQELSSRSDRKSGAPARKLRKDLSELLDEWRTQSVTVEAAIERLDDAWSARNTTERQSVRVQEIADWLGSLWWQESVADGGGDLKAEWEAATSRLIRLADVANLQSFMGPSGIASAIPTVRVRFHQDLLRALQAARGSRLIAHSAQIFEHGSLQRNSMTEMSLLDVAVPAETTGKDISESAGSWQKISTPAALPAALTDLRNFGDGHPVALFRSMGEFQSLLKVLDELLRAEVLLTIQAKESEQFGRRPRKLATEQSFRVLELLHCETLKTEVGGREYTLGREKRGPGISSREYCRQLLTLGDGTEEKPSRLQITHFRKANRDPVDEITVELKRRTGANADWFRSRDEFKACLESFDGSLREAQKDLFPVPLPKN